MAFIDRRLNPKGKSLANRQRFMRRAQSEIRDAVHDAIKKRKVSEVDEGERVRIRSSRIHEPSFHHSRSGGNREYVVPGNKEFVVGDTIDKSPSGGGGGGSEGSPDGEGQDEFAFTLSRDEFLDVFFEDLALPDLIKAKVARDMSEKPSRAGFTVAGTPSQLNLVRSMRNSLARRISLSRPSDADIEALGAEIARRTEDGATEEQLAPLLEQLEKLEARRKAVPYLDPVDLRYNRFEKVPKPTTQAVMFCLMDTSASMSEHKKDLAKRFFMLLHLFLTRRYRHVDLVFIRHTSTAQEVDEQTFFYSRETGGTIVSSALEEMRRVVADRYPVSDWNIYAAQASDGDNYSSDTPRVVDLLESHILGMCQYFAYIEVAESRSSRLPHLGDDEGELWRAYGSLADSHLNFARRRASSASEIFPVFHDLFARQAA